MSVSVDEVECPFPATLGLENFGGRHGTNGTNRRGWLAEKLPVLLKSYLLASRVKDVVVDSASSAPKGLGFSFKVREEGADALWM